MKKYVYGLGALVAPSLIGMLVATGCTKEDGTSGLPGGDDICGPCGEIAKGDVGISGDLRLDGFFKATSRTRPPRSRPTSTPTFGRSRPHTTWSWTPTQPSTLRSSAS